MIPCVGYDEIIILMAANQILKKRTKQEDIQQEKRNARK